MSVVLVNDISFSYGFEVFPGQVNLESTKSRFEKQEQPPSVFLFPLSLFFCLVSLATDSKEEEVKVPKKFFLGMYSIALSATKHQL